MHHLQHTLTTLENKDWGPPTADSHLVTECHCLRHVLLKVLSIPPLPHEHATKQTGPPAMTILGLCA